MLPGGTKEADQPAQFFEQLLKKKWRLLAVEKLAFSMKQNKGCVNFSANRPHIPQHMNGFNRYF